MALRYIDTHVHFWDRDRLPYTWLDDLPAIAPPHTPATYQAETAVTPPEKIVFLQCISDLARALDEVAWVEELAQAEPRIAGIVASCAMDAGDATLALLDALAARPLVKGVRHNVQDEARGFATRDTFVAGVQACGERGLSFDLCCYHPQLPDLTELVTRCPGTAFILDHLGKPGIRAGVIDPWRAELAALAARPNVTAKLSGIITEADFARWTIDDLRPYVEHYVATFGPDRMVWGSDWPVAKLAGTHAGWLATARELLAGLPADAQDAIFYRNALRVYRL